MQREIQGSDSGFDISLPASANWAAEGVDADGWVTLNVYPEKNPLGSGPGEGQPGLIPLPEWLTPVRPFAPLAYDSV